MGGLIIFIIWFVISIAVGAAANARGRSGFGWFLLAFFLSPILALLLLIAFPVKSGAGADLNDGELMRNIQRSRGEQQRGRSWW